MWLPSSLRCSHVYSGGGLASKGITEVPSEALVFDLKIQEKCLSVQQTCALCSEHQLSVGWSGPWPQVTKEA